MRCSRLRRGSARMHWTIDQQLMKLCGHYFSHSYFRQSDDGHDNRRPTAQPSCQADSSLVRVAVCYVPVIASGRNGLRRGAGTTRCRACSVHENWHLHLQPAAPSRIVPSAFPARVSHSTHSGAQVFLHVRTGATFNVRVLASAGFARKRPRLARIAEVAAS